MKTDRNMEDMALLSSLRKGEQQAFDSLFRKYYPMLCAYARRFVELEDAEEIVQEIMLWIWEKHSELIIESSLSQYLFDLPSGIESDSQERNHQPGRSSFLYQESGNTGRCELLSNKRTDQKN